LWHKTTPVTQIDSRGVPPLGGIGKYPVKVSPLIGRDEAMDLFKHCYGELPHQQNV